LKASKVVISLSREGNPVISRKWSLSFRSVFVNYICNTIEPKGVHRHTILAILNIYVF
jgi:hypothetical protein